MSATDRSGTKRISRRSHHKSRLGCSNCKIRHMKCDENKPVCANCFKHSIECDFTVARHASTEPETSCGSTSSSLTATSRNRFRIYQRPVVQMRKKNQNTSEQKSPTYNSVGVQCNLSLSVSNHGISFADLHLFYHYVASTSRTLQDGTDDTNKWQLIIEQNLSYRPFLHLLLAFAALHLSRQRPESREEYVKQADDHYTLGIQHTTSEISGLDVESCQRVYLATVLICLVGFGRGPRPGEYLVFSDSGPGEWYKLLYGVKTTRESYRDNVFVGVLSPEDDLISKDISPELRDELLEHWDYLRRLQIWLSAQTPDENIRKLSQFAIQTLRHTFHEVYQHRSNAKGGVGLMHIILGWLYRLPQDFVSYIEQKSPFALVILANWAMLLKYMRSVWFMEGWDVHITSHIRKVVTAEFQAWVEWPLQHVQKRDE